MSFVAGIPKSRLQGDTMADGVDPAMIEWEDCGFMLDCAYGALGDTRLLDDDRWIECRLPNVMTDDDGFGMIYATAECDGLPVEVGRIDGAVVAVRLEFTDDVAEMVAASEAKWETIGRVRIGEQGALALDKKQQHLDPWKVAFEVPAGRYDAQACMWDGECLGIRLLSTPNTDLSSEPMPGQRPRLAR